VFSSFAANIIDSLAAMVEGIYSDCTEFSPGVIGDIPRVVGAVMKTNDMARADMPLLSVFFTLFFRSQQNGSLMFIEGILYPAAPRRDNNKYF
jgi:hypothetical protein